MLIYYLRNVDKQALGTMRMPMMCGIENTRGKERKEKDNISCREHHTTERGKTPLFFWYAVEIMTSENGKEIVIIISELSCVRVGGQERC